MAVGKLYTAGELYAAGELHVAGELYVAGELLYHWRAVELCDVGQATRRGCLGGAWHLTALAQMGAVIRRTPPG